MSADGLVDAARAVLGAYTTFLDTDDLDVLRDALTALTVALDKDALLPMPEEADMTDVDREREAAITAAGMAAMRRADVVLAANSALNSIYDARDLLNAGPYDTTVAAGQVYITQAERALRALGAVVIEESDPAAALRTAATLINEGLPGAWAQVAELLRMIADRHHPAPARGVCACGNGLPCPDLVLGSATTVAHTLLSQRGPADA